MKRRVTVGKLRLLDTTDDCYGISKHGTTFFELFSKWETMPNASIRIEESKYRHMSISPWKIAAVPFAGIALRPANELSRQLGERREVPGWYAAAALYLREFLDTCKRYATLADDARPAATQPARPKGERTTFHPLLSAFITLPPPLGPFAAGRLSGTTFGARARSARLR